MAIDKKEMELQEEYDFQITSLVMKDLYTKYNATYSMEKMPTYSSVDATMSVHKGERKNQYKVEIKSRYVNNEEYKKTMPITVEKFLRVKESSVNATPLVVYLLNNEQYYIFNLNKIDLNKVIMKLWKIEKIQYSETSKKEEIPTIFLPVDMAVCTGDIPKNNISKPKKYAHD